MEYIQEIIDKQVGFVKNFLKTTSEAKQYCFGYLDALEVDTSLYDEISRTIDETFERLDDEMLGSD